MKELVIRKATKKDLKDIIELNALLFKEDGGQRDRYVNTYWPYQEGKKHFTRLLNDENSFLYVVEMQKVIGYLTGYTRKVERWRPVERTEIESMYIRKEFRGRGIGKKLVDIFIKWSKKAAAKTVLVTTLHKNSRAVKFYKRKGFKPTSLSLELELINKF